jgi:exosortase
LAISVSTTNLARSNVGVLVLWIASLLWGWRALVNTFALSLRDEEYTYILLIFPVCAVLLFLQRGSIRQSIAVDFRLGPPLLLIASAIACCSYIRPTSIAPDVRLSIAMFALVLWWVGDFVLWFGARASRRALFPLFFLFGLVPLPRAILDTTVERLQIGSALTAHALFWMAGVPVDQSGVFVTIPGLTLQVAQECSSIRSSSMLLATTVVLAQIMLVSPWRKLILIGLAVPVSVAKNGLRIFTIAMLGTRVDPGYLTGRLHHQGGIVFFAIALIAVFLLLWILRRGEVKERGIGANLKENAASG